MIDRMIGSRAFYVLAALIIFCTGLPVFLFYDRERTNVALSLEVGNSIRHIERSIGYAGFIHNFKNHVLRPDNPLYSERAKASYQVATREIAVLQSILARIDITVDVSKLQTTLKNYYDAIDEISKAHLRGMSIAAIDRQFRVSDEDAATTLVALQTHINELLEERHQSTERLLWLSLLFFIVAAISLIASLANTWFQRQREQKREYIRQSPASREGIGTKQVAF